MPTFHTADDVERIGRCLIDRSLPKSDWTHAAHFAAALWLLKRDGWGACQSMPPLIMAYNEATGVANTDSSGYHETITHASLRAAHFWLLQLPDVPLHEVMRAMFESPLGRSDWLLKYWSKAALYSVKARRAWLEPDLAALPY